MKRLGKISLVSVFALALVFVACVLLEVVFAVPISGAVTDKLGAYTGAGAGQGHNVKASLDLAHTDLDAILADTGTTLNTTVDAILVDTAAMDTAAELQVLIAGGYRCATKALTALATANDLFAVSGGPIIIRDIIAVVQSGGMVATACELHYNIDPTAPATDTPFATDGTSLEINGDAEGSVYTWDGVVATDLTVTTNGVVLTQGVDVSAGLLCPIGMIETVASATNAGDITFYLVYSPLSPSSVVTPQ